MDRDADAHRGERRFLPLAWPRERRETRWPWIDVVRDLRRRFLSQRARLRDRWRRFRGRRSALSDPVRVEGLSDSPAGQTARFEDHGGPRPRLRNNRADLEHG